MMSTLVFLDPEISTQADEAQSPRVPVTFPKDPYDAIRQAYLVETDTKFEPFEDPVKTETPESPHNVASPTSLPDCTSPIRHAKESKDSDTTTRMAVRVLIAMSPGLSASIAEVAAISDSTFRKRFRSSYESSPSSSTLDLPLQKRSWGTSELVEVAEEEDDEEEDEDVEEGSNLGTESEDVKEEGLAVGDEVLDAEDEGLGLRVKSLGLGGDEAVPEGQQRAAPVVETAVREPLRLGYKALRHREITSREGQIPSVFEVGQGSGSVPEPERRERECNT
nr:hypothetical protein [Tanacetum cinerariifolium]